MNREVHVWFCEGLGVKFPRATRLKGFRTAKKPVSRNPQFFMKYSGVRNAHSRLLVFVFFN